MVNHREYIAMPFGGDPPDAAPGDAVIAFTLPHSSQNTHPGSHFFRLGRSWDPGHSPGCSAPDSCGSETGVEWRHEACGCHRHSAGVVCNAGLRPERRFAWRIYRRPRWRRVFRAPGRLLRRPQLRCAQSALLPRWIRELRAQRTSPLRRRPRPASRVHSASSSRPSAGSLCSRTIHPASGAGFNAHALPRRARASGWAHSFRTAPIQSRVWPRRSRYLPPYAVPLSLRRGSSR